MPPIVQNKYLLEYESNGARRPAEIYAASFEDAQDAIASMKKSLTLKGVLNPDVTHQATPETKNPLFRWVFRLYTAACAPLVRR